MTIVETVFVVSTVFNVLCMFLVFVVFANMIKIKTLIEQMHMGLGGVVGKVVAIEQTTNKMAQSFTEFIKMAEAVVDRMDDDERISSIYKTSDGKFSARTLDELINKIRSSGEESEYFSSDELDKLKNLFSEDEDLFDDEDDENS
jgi:hypothetical protein